MKPWLKNLLVVLGILLAIPLIPIAFVAFMLFVFYPLQHKVHVVQADRANTAAWETAEAQVATVSVDFSNGETTRTESTQLLCWQGETARPWDLKAGAPRRFAGVRAERPEYFETELTSGATVFVSLRNLCWSLQRNDMEETQQFLQNAELRIISSESQRYCRLTSGARPTGPVAMSSLRLDRLETRPLRDVIAQDALSSSATPMSTSPFWQRYKNTLRRTIWDPIDRCWTGSGRTCDPVLTATCPPRDNQ